MLIQKQKPAGEADVPIAIDGTTTLKLKLTLAEWCAVFAVLAGIAGFLIQGDRRIGQNEHVTRSNTEAIIEIKQDIASLNQNLTKMVEYQVVQSRLDQQLLDVMQRLNRIEQRVDASDKKP